VVPVDDRALVAALVSGDPRGLEGAYRAYADRLYSYCRGMLRDPDAAADAVHDTFVLASQRAGQLREPDRLRSWLYAIARNECLRMLRGRRRHAPLEEAGQVSAPETDPVAGLRAAEIQELVWAAAEGLNPGDREVFELAIRHELPAPEIGELLGVSVAHAHARLSRARTQLERALGALLVARTGRQDCPQLAELLGNWDGKLTALLRKRVSRHVEDCPTCQERQRRQLRPAALFSAYAAVPFLAVPAELWPRLERTSFDPGAGPARDAIAQRAGRFDPQTGFPRPLDLRRRRMAVAGVAAIAVAALLAAGAGAMVPPVFLSAEEPGPLPTAAAVASPTPSPSASATPSPSASPTATASGSPAAPAPSPPPPPPPPSTGPPPNTPPSVADVVASPGAIRPDHRGCAVADPDTAIQSLVRSVVTDADDASESLRVSFRYELSTDRSVADVVTMSRDGSGDFVGVLGPFAYGAVPEDGGLFSVRVSAADPDGAVTTADEVVVTLHGCGPAG
jgi:RNA polymerase sigma factor (sigma-70 family)